MTDREDEHRYSAGEGFEDPYEGFDLEPPELSVGPDEVDPIDSRVLADLLDERQLAADDVDVETLIEVGLEYVRINRFEEATETLERAARFADEEAHEQEAWVNKGVAHAELEEYDQAIGAYREALGIDAEGEHAGTARANLAYALWEAGHDERAMVEAERAVEADERLPQAWYNRGFILQERGLHEDAVRCFDNAIRLGMRNPGVLEEKARALEALDEHERAERAAEEADRLREQAEERLVDE